VDGTSKPKIDCRMVKAATPMMPEQMMRNAWLHHDYPWFVLPNVANGSMVMEVMNVAPM
jgi:hypothetical protein